jgi:hypothetical protein
VKAVRSPLAADDYWAGVILKGVLWRNVNSIPHVVSVVMMRASVTERDSSAVLCIASAARRLSRRGLVRLRVAGKRNDADPSDCLPAML